MLSNGIPSDSYQVGDRVLFKGFAVPVLGTITRVAIRRSEDSWDVSEVRVHDIRLDDGEILIDIWDHIDPVPPEEL